MSASVTPEPVRLNLGSGPQIVDGWISIDKSWGPVLARHGTARAALHRLGVLDEGQASLHWPPEIQRIDLTRKWPWPEGSVDAIYSSHFLEHVRPSHARALLEHCHTALRPGGILRIALPDLEAGAREYVRRRDEGDPKAADDFLEFLWLSPEQHGNVLRRLAMAVIHRPHAWMYDADSMADRLRATGFVDVVRRDYHEGELPDLHSIETRPNSFFLEAKR